MNLDREDEKLEAYLRQFRPLPPAPLAVKEQRFVLAPVLRVAMGLAAVILIAMAVFLLRSRHNQRAQKPAQPAVQAESPAQEISLIYLSRIAQQEPDRLGEHLDQLSTQLLPDVRSGRGVLGHLARQ
jgi:hypothetical protein